MNCLPMTVTRLLSVGYLSGKSKTNPEMLMAKQALPDLSGTKINTDGAVLSLSQTEAPEPTLHPKIDTVTIENTTTQSDSIGRKLSADQPLQVYTLSQNGDVKFIEPQYSLHGVTFSYDDIKIAKEYLEGMTAIMRESGVFSLILDYDDYAIMGLGESHIRVFGNEQGFTSEQTEALVVDYRESIGALVNKHLGEFPFDRQVTNLPTSEYFFVNRSEESWIGGYHVKEGTPISTPDLAVNWKMIRNTYEMMASVDQTSNSSLKNAVAQFEKEAVTARRSQTSVPAWANYRVGIYMENIAKFEDAADSFRCEMNTKYPHLDAKV
ncbi:MAG: hypothetical protein IKC03_03485, partial [Oscillospiraceae bacterium]|nr:hypothetical protein [Oscillospiraceae bacterium]